MALELLLQHAKQTVHLNLVLLGSYPEQVPVLDNSFLPGVRTLRHLFGPHKLVVVVCVLLHRFTLLGLTIKVTNIPDVQSYFSVPPKLLALALHGTLRGRSPNLRLDDYVLLIYLRNAELVDEQHLTDLLVSDIIEDQRAQSQKCFLDLAEVHDLAEHRPELVVGGAYLLAQY